MYMKIFIPAEQNHIIIQFLIMTHFLLTDIQIRLTDRIVVDNAIIFQILDGSIYEYYILFELIDSAKGTTTEGEKNNYYKIYLK